MNDDVVDTEDTPANGTASRRRQGLPNYRLDREAQWAWFERHASTRGKDRGRFRLEMIQYVEALMATGYGKSSAVEIVATYKAVSKASIYGWFHLIRGVEGQDRLAYITPGFVGGGYEKPIDQMAWKILQSLYLTSARRGWESCYEEMVEKYAAPRGLAVPSSRTLYRRLQREVDPAVIELMRHHRCPDTGVLQNQL